MRPLVLTLVASLVTFLAIWLQPPRAHVDAGTALHMDVADLVDASALVLEGRVVAANTEEDALGIIRTRYDILVDRTFWGEPDSLQTVVLPGGVLEDGRGMLVAGMPVLPVGQRGIFFFTEPGPRGMRMPVGLAQGALRLVEANGVTSHLVRDATDLQVVDPAKGTLVRATGVDVLDYAGVVASIHSAVASRKARGLRAPLGD